MSKYLRASEILTYIVYLPLFFMNLKDGFAPFSAAATTMDIHYTFLEFLPLISTWTLKINKMVVLYTIDDIYGAKY